MDSLVASLEVYMLRAWIDSEGSGAAFVFDSGFSAVRSADGDWTSPSPSTNLRDLSADGFISASPSDAAALAKEARMAGQVSVSNALVAGLEQPSSGEPKC